MISFLIDPKVVPGRMGLLVTLFLISVNVYNSMDGPPDRGVSYVEIWILGTQCPLILGLLEYAVVLTLLKKSSKIDAWNDALDDVNANIQKYDNGTFIFSISYYLLFVVTYWSVVFV